MMRFTVRPAPSPGEIASLGRVELLQLRDTAITQIHAARRAGHRPEQSHWSRVLLGADYHLGKPAAYGVEWRRDGVSVNTQVAIQRMLDRGEEEIHLRPDSAKAKRPARTPVAAARSDDKADVARRVSEARQALYGTGTRDGARERARAIRAGMRRST